MMKRFLIPLVLLTLAACAQAPIPSDGAQPDLEPLVFGGSGDEGVTDLAKHSTGVYTVGATTNTPRPNPRGETDVFVRKHNSSGAAIWTRKFGTANSEFASSAASDPSDNVYVAGSVADTFGGQTAFIRKYRADGQLTWTRRFSDNPTGDAPPITFVSDVAAYGSKAVYVVGGTYGKLSGSVGSGDIFVRKYTSSGSVSWTRQFDLSEEECCRDYVGSVAVDGSGNAYVVGATENPPRETNRDGADTFIRKYSPGGNVVWTRQLDFGVIDGAQAVAVSGSNVYLGVVYITDADADNGEGYVFDARIIKFSTSGIRAQGWGYVYNTAGSDSVNDLSTDREGSLYFSGTTQALDTFNADGFVVKLKPSGTRVWSKRVASSGNESANAVLARTPFEVYVAGSTTGVLGAANRGNLDPFLRRLRGSDGSTVWTEQ